MAVRRNHSDLSPREIEIFNHIALGKNNKEIARDLGISSRTVEAHRRNIYSKKGVKNGAALISVLLSNVNFDMEPNGSLIASIDDVERMLRSTLLKVDHIREVAKRLNIESSQLCDSA